MEDIRDCKGRLACKGDAVTGFIESVYRGQKTTTFLPVGAEFTIEKEGVVTKVTRVTVYDFHIDSYIIAA